MDVFSDSASFEKDLEGYIEKTEIRKFDISLLIFTLIINVSIGAAMYFLSD